MRGWPTLGRSVCSMAHLIMAALWRVGMLLGRFPFPGRLQGKAATQVGRIPLSHNWPSGVIRMGSQYEGEKVEKFGEQTGLKGCK